MSEAKSLNSDIEEKKECKYLILNARGVHITVPEDVIMRLPMLAAYATGWKREDPIFVNYSAKAVHRILDSIEVDIHDFLGLEMVSKPKILTIGDIIDDNGKLKLDLDEYMTISITEFHQDSCSVNVTFNEKLIFFQVRMYAYKAAQVNMYTAKNFTCGCGLCTILAPFSKERVSACISWVMQHHISEIYGITHATGILRDVA